MKWISIGMIYCGFFALIAFAVWMTGSGLPLWALLFLPGYKEGK